MRTIDVAERRNRLARRHAVAPACRVGDVVDAAATVVCLHGTDPATIALSAWARVDGFDVADLDEALYVDRSLVKHLAMRRTLFVFPRPILAAAQAGASARVAAAEERRLVKEVEAAGLHDDGRRWLDRAMEEVVAALADGREATSSELRADLPVLEGSMTFGEGRSWGGTVSVGPRVLTVLAARGQVVRATNDGAWTASRPRWTSMAAWLGEPLPPLSEDEGRAQLVTAWLRAFGPGTEADIKWWLGSTLTLVRRTLAEIGAIEVDLDGATGYLLPDDLDPPEPVDAWVALLPPLDPTTMGWTERGWYLGPYKDLLFDTAGNAGPTVWCDGRIVGGWRQHGDGDVQLQLLEDIGADARAALDAEADRLTSWFGGIRILPRYPSPLSKTDVGLDR